MTDSQDWWPADGILWRSDDSYGVHSQELQDCRRAGRKQTQVTSALSSEQLADNVI